VYVVSFQSFVLICTAFGSVPVSAGDLSRGLYAAEALRHHRLSCVVLWQCSHCIHLFCVPSRDNVCTGNWDAEAVSVLYDDGSLMLGS